MSGKVNEFLELSELVAVVEIVFSPSKEKWEAAKLQIFTKTIGK